MADKKYDFIVVGSGPAGSALAYRLASTKAAPEVLLLEAGGDNSDPEAMRLADRYTVFHAFPEMEYGYLTVPQKHLANRQVSAARGKGLGGSSAVNFCFYTRGSKDDFDEWARLVGDDFHNWENTERRYKKLEGYGSIDTPAQKKYADWKPEHHGNGPVKLSNPPVWEDNLETGIKAAMEHGHKLNLDYNDGDPMGVAVLASTGWQSKRTTAKTAYLENVPKNLTIMTHAPATKIIFEGKKAVGITAGGKDYHATKEVILSAGAIDTPKLLMLSGIGPKSELEKHSIPLLADLPVGLSLQDHVQIVGTLEMQTGWDKRHLIATPEGKAAAKKQFEKDCTGPYSFLNNGAMIGFSKSSDSVYQSKEFQDLPEDVQRYMRKPTVPGFEFSGLTPTYPIPGFDPSHSYNTIMSFLMNPQSKGSVALASSNPDDAPLIDPQYFSHPYDRLSFIDAVKRGWKLVNDPIYSPNPKGVFIGPKSDSDEDIQELIENLAAGVWHFSCTAKMGKANDPEAVVTSDFRVKGFEGLRVADVSVTPLLPNAHTVSIGYLMGEAAAERITLDYGLDK